MHPSIMFHHFHNEQFYQSPGSITAEHFRRLIDQLQEHFVIKPAAQYEKEYHENSLSNRDVALTFDDGLLSQYDIARPVLEEYNLTAFWFVYSAALTDERYELEVNRYFTSKYFDDAESFHQAFFSKLPAIGIDVEEQVIACEEKSYLKEFSFYSKNDRVFRYIRNHVLSHEAYLDCMDQLMHHYHFDKSSIVDQLFIKEDHIQRLARDGHVIGAHSHTHPTYLAQLTKHEQRQEYVQNIEYLSSVISAPVTSMAHPCNSYNQDTLEVLGELGITMGFRSNNCLTHGSALELPRLDHTLILETN